MTDQIKGWRLPAPDMPTVQEVFAADTVPPPAALRERGTATPALTPVDRSRYWSQHFHDLEVECVWRRTWQVACREEDIPTVGDSVVYDIADDSLIVVRTPTAIKAFHNSCLHRGTMLRTTDGTARRFRCPMHGFTWNLEGELIDLPCSWDFPHVEPREWRLPEAQVDTWGGFVFVNMDQSAESLTSYLEILPVQYRAFPAEERWKTAHVRKIVPCNWKITLEAFLEAFHLATTHRQALPFTGDINSQCDVWPGVRHISRMLTLFAVSSPRLDDAEPDDDAIEMMMPPGDSTRRPVDLSVRQFIAERHRRHYENRFDTDLSHATDAEILDTIQYFVFPNFVPWAGIGQPVQYLFRPNGSDPETSIMDVMVLAPLPADGSRPSAAKVRLLGLDDPFTEAPELGKFAPIFEQDIANLPRLQRGVKAGRKQNDYANYQESRLRHFHQTLDSYVGRSATASLDRGDTARHAHQPTAVNGPAGSDHDGC